jgi:hypothetical protein
MPAAPRGAAGPTRAQIAQLQREARRQAAEDAFHALVELMTAYLNSVGR